MSNEIFNSESTTKDEKNPKKGWNPMVTIGMVVGFLAGAPGAILGMLALYDKSRLEPLREENIRLKAKIEAVEKDIRTSDTYLNLKKDLSITYAEAELFENRLNICLSEKGDMNGLDYKIKSIERDLEYCRTSKNKALSEKNKTITILTERADILRMISTLQEAQAEIDSEINAIGTTAYGELTGRGEILERRLNDKKKMIQEQITALVEALKAKV
ncbi:hypothetical protein [Microbulbifer sp. TRSA005]|uniref:hypothetical protein n=1 Tax=unclassified Microbulbifer TaxID=2619833 RepID=UPI00403A4D31